MTTPHADLPSGGGGSGDELTQAMDLLVEIHECVQVYPRADARDLPQLTITYAGHARRAGLEVERMLVLLKEALGSATGVQRSGQYRIDQHEELVRAAIEAYYQPE
jgi:hypothetical protein